MLARMVDQNAAHHLGRDSEEMVPILPPCAGLIDEPHVGLVHEGGRLQRMAGAFARKVPPGQRTQFVIDAIEQLFVGILHAVGSVDQQIGDFLPRRHRHGTWLKIPFLKSPCSQIAQSVICFYRTLCKEIPHYTNTFAPCMGGRCDRHKVPQQEQSGRNFSESTGAWWKTDLFVKNAAPRRCGVSNKTAGRPTGCSVRKRMDNAQVITQSMDISMGATEPPINQLEITPWMYQVKAAAPAPQ